METGRGEKAQCQSGQLGGNKAAVNGGDAVHSLHTGKHGFFPSLLRNYICKMYLHLHVPTLSTS